MACYVLRENNNSGSKQVYTVTDFLPVWNPVCTVIIPYLSKCLHYYSAYAHQTFQDGDLYEELPPINLHDPLITGSSEIK